MEAKRDLSQKLNVARHRPIAWVWLCWTNHNQQGRVITRLILRSRQARNMQKKLHRAKERSNLIANFKQDRNIGPLSYKYQNRSKASTSGIKSPSLFHSFWY